MTVIPPSGTLPWECHTTILYLAMTVRPPSCTLQRLSNHHPTPCHDCHNTILYLAMTVRPPSCTLPWDRQTVRLCNDCQTHHHVLCQETVIIWQPEVWPFATSSPSSTSSSLTPTSPPPLSKKNREIAKSCPEKSHRFWRCQVVFTKKCHYYYCHYCYCH